MTTDTKSPLAVRRLDASSLDEIERWCVGDGPDPEPDFEDRAIETVRRLAFEIRALWAKGHKRFIVIERYQHGQLEYWWPGMKTDGWTPKIEDAVKFFDHDSANYVLTRLCGGIGRICEHSFVEGQ